MLNGGNLFVHLIYVTCHEKRDLKLQDNILQVERFKERLTKKALK